MAEFWHNQQSFHKRSKNRKAQPLLYLLSILKFIGSHSSSAVQHCFHKYKKSLLQINCNKKHSVENGRENNSLFFPTRRQSKTTWYMLDPAFTQPFDQNNAVRLLLLFIQLIYCSFGLSQLDCWEYQSRQANFHDRFHKFLSDFDFLCYFVWNFFSSVPVIPLYKTHCPYSSSVWLKVTETVDIVFPFSLISCCRLVCCRIVFQSHLLNLCSCGYCKLILWLVIVVWFLLAFFRVSTPRQQVGADCSMLLTFVLRHIENRESKIFLSDRCVFFEPDVC